MPDPSPSIEMSPAGMPPVVVVYGALRSGTTMFRLMLNSHPGVTNPGEVDFLFDHIHPDPDHPTGWRYDRTGLQVERIFRAHDLHLDPGLDGLDLLACMLRQFAARAPGSVLTVNAHRHARRVAELLPKATFIHMLRDPRDVARSCIGMGWFGTSYHGVIPWIETETDWDRGRPLIADDRLLTMTFEDLMRDLCPTLARVCDFLGVPEDPAMLRYHETSSYDAPDPAIAQQWRRKTPPRIVALIEGRCADLMAARGYPPECGPRSPGRAEAARLAIQNRTVRWNYNIRFFGLPLFAAHHATRLLGLRRLHARVRLRMDARRVAQLK